MPLSVSRTELTPLSFLGRSVEVYPASTAVVHGDRRVSYADFGAEVTRLAQAFRASGIEAGDRVAYLCPNTPEMLAAHFAVPLAGAVLVAVNTRLSPAEVGYILEHSGSKLLVVDAELHPMVAPVLGELPSAPEVVTVSDRAADPLGVDASDERVSGPSYAELLERGSAEPLPWTVDNEDAPISINYTSGTTGQPKGVVYTHRGAYLNALGEVVHAGYESGSRYLWTLPMFHCNGWCMTWAVTAVGGRHICLRKIEGEAIWRLVDDEGITHLNGAPPVLNMLANADSAHPPAQQLLVGQAGGPPNPADYRRLTRLSILVRHIYGLTETYGPYSLCEEQPSWQELGEDEQLRLRTRQGVGMVQAERLRVVDENMADVPADGQTMGEIVMHGNNVMRGYFEDERATDEAFRGGWFHSGDLGVLHPDGYVELRDRAKDIVVSGGENISTVEVEQALNDHPAVVESAVVGVPDEKWGERPKAFVVLRAGGEAGQDELLSFVRERLAGYKVPGVVELVDELPKTSTGKVQKYELRQKEWEGRERRIS